MSELPHPSKPERELTAPAIPLSPLSLAQLIGLSLARLYAWLVRLQASGQKIASPDMAQRVRSTHALVHAYIRMRAAAQLEHAGYSNAARAMRDPVRQAPQPVAHTGMAPSSLAELIASVEATIEQFQRAEEIASDLARIIVCALLFVSPEPCGRSDRTMVKAHPANRPNRLGQRTPKLNPMNRGPPCRFRVSARRSRS